mgnify:CR=1 FL=1
MSSYDRYMKKMKELHDDYPSLAEEEARIGLERLGTHIDKNNSVVHTKLFGDVEIRKLLYIGLFILIGLVGIATFFQPLDGDAAIPMYVFGMVFFVTGFCIGTMKDGKYFGIIFLFSHGMTGYGLMTSSVLGDILDSPLLSDGNTTFIFFYIALWVILVCLGIGSSIIYNLSDKLKAKNKYPILQLGFFAIAIMMAAALPFIIKGF